MYKNYYNKTEENFVSTCIIIVSKYNIYITQQYGIL